MSDSGPVLLRCGPLSATFVDGDLFDVRWGGAEVAQRLYLAVRDEVWNTIPGSLSDLVIEEADDRFGVSFTATHEHGDIAFAWTGTIRADSAGLLSYEMRGRALSDFAYCKIGFNVHHGLRAHAGRAFRCRTLDGEHSGGFGPEVVPQLVRDGTLTAMTPHYDRIDLDLGDLRVTMEFDGDRFEMQDHRNWIDANWKSYGTPLSYGFPMRITAGTELHQSVTIRIDGPVPGLRQETVTAMWSGEVGGVLPRVGHRIVNQPDQGQIDRLRELRPSHLRYDRHPGEDSAGLRAAADLADALGAGLEVAVFVRPDQADADALAAARALAEVIVPVDRVLVLVETTGFSAFGGACPPAVAQAVQIALVECGLDVRVVAGTKQSFVDVNRDRPDYRAIDGVVFAANPQVHAADDRSLMQNVQAIPDVVGATRRIYGDVDVVLSPVDLIGADGPFPGGPAAPGGPPSNEDPRQRTAFAAAWAVAALAQMARCRTTATTVFELAGPRGMVDDGGDLFPVAQVLRELAPHYGSAVRGVEVDDPDRLAVLAVGPADGPVLAANLTSGALAAVLPDGQRLDFEAYEVLLVTADSVTPLAGHRTEC
jgi:hypothetical protein